MSRLTLLDRASATVSYSTPLQSQVDGLVGSFAEQATDWRSLASIMAGGMAYRVGRVGVMGLGSGNAVRFASVGLGLAAEVSTFELTHRGLTTLSGRGSPMWPPAPGSTIGGRPYPFGHRHGGAPTNHGESNLWRWSGPGGIRQGFLQSFITFGALKSAGHFARGENFLVQHLLQDTAMVMGHQVSGVLGIAPRPTGTLAEQFLHAEATNLQLGAGMALAHRLAPAVHGLERGLDLAIRLTPSPLSLSLEGFGGELSRTGEGGRRSGEGGLMRRFHPALAGIPGEIRRPLEVRKGPEIFQMSDASDIEGKGSRFPETLPGPGPAREPEQRVSPVVKLEGGTLRLVPEAVLDEAGHYKIIKYLGSGGFGDVYLVRDTHFDREVVAKIPRKERYNAETLARFRQEGNIGGRLDPRFAAWVLEVVELREEIADTFRNTPPKEASGKAHRRRNTPPSKKLPAVAIIQEFVVGHDLHTVLFNLSENHTEYVQKYTLERRLELFAEVCQAVHSAHEQGVIHRDLKPENIRVTNDLHVRVMDWGQAKLLKEPSNPPPPDGGQAPGGGPSSIANFIEPGESPLTLPGFITGTPGYMPPEAAEGQPPNQRTDIFALGMLGYQMFSLHHPHTIYRNGDRSKGEPPLVPERSPGNVTRIDSAASYVRGRWQDPPSFAEIAPGEHPPYFYEAEKIFRRAFDPEEEERHETAAELREEILWVRARSDYAQILKIRSEQAESHRKAVVLHSRFSVREQTPTEQWDEMHDKVEEAKQLREEWRERANDLITHLTDRLRLLGHPEPARAMISELKGMLYLDKGDRATREVREGYIRKIEENEVISDDAMGFGWAAAINGKMPVALVAEDFVTGQPLSPENLRLDAFPLEREVNAQNRETGNYRVGKPIHRGLLSALGDSFQLAAGYYAMVLSAPSYAPLRLPLRISLEDVRRFFQHSTPFPLRLGFIPRNQVPHGFAVIQAGVATLGHDFYHEGVPSKVWSRPQFSQAYDTFLAAMKPVSVGEYFQFIDHELNAVNALIRNGEMERAWYNAVRVREYLPRRRHIIPDLSDELQNLGSQRFADRAFMQNAFSQLLLELDLYWKVRLAPDGSEHFGFQIQNPSTHRDPNNDPIYLDQPITAESNLGAEAYTRWKSEREGRDYFIISADQSELIARNAFPWYYSWGYRSSPAYAVMRTSFRDPNNDSYPQRIGTHPQGRRNYRDRSLFGPLDVIGNGRKFTGSHDEPGTVVLVGGGPRNPPGPYFDPWGRTSMPRNQADQSNGVFRLGLRPDKSN